jgi:hypothetical protein
MRIRFPAVVTVLALGFCSGVGASPAARSISSLPRDAATLQELDSQQLRIVRRASALCRGAGIGAGGSLQIRACVMGLADRSVTETKSDVLLAFHNAIPFNVRYDEFRQDAYWQRLVAR